MQSRQITLIYMHWRVRLTLLTVIKGIDYKLEWVEIQKFLKLNMYPMDSEGSHKYKILLLKKNFPTQLTQISICVFLTFS